MTEKKRMARMTKLGEDDGQFDFEYWQQFTPEERVEAIWQATLDWAALKGLHENQLRLQRTEFGAPMSQVTADDFAKLGTVFQIGMPPSRVDVLNELSGGVAFDDAWKQRATATLDGIPTQFIGIHELVKNKVASGRPQDVVDVRSLKRVLAKRK